ncbi:DUF1491 family protein [Stakelama marina]|uniref:DUF1491 family protein n=1 Tax=Stakelama marina TaxID=2826939 RepID=A0A8T4IIP2_9SPHN|nr:DUF1491 family protein [Stakelama marina]MBR0552975.1 DUF1491 family protein [Stakelama marina]
MSARVASGVLVKALMRHVQAAGGHATLLARGDENAGAILVLALERGADPRFFERGIGPDGTVQLLRSGPRDSENADEIDSYRQKRRRSDPDLWIVELDIAEAERFAAEILLPG